MGFVDSIKNRLFNVSTGEVLTEQQREEAREELYGEAIETGESPALEKEYEINASIKYYSLNKLSNYTEPQKGETDGTTFSYRPDESYGVFVCFTPQRRLARVINGELIPCDLSDIGKASYIFVNFEKMIVASWGVKKALVSKILAQTFDLIEDLELSDLLNPVNISQFEEIKKLEIHATNAEALISDIKYSALFKPLEFCEAKQGVIRLHGSFKSDFVEKLVSYLCAAGDSSRLIPKMKISGSLAAGGSVDLDLYQPKAAVSMKVVSKSPILTDYNELTKLARWIFSEMPEDVTSEPPVYCNTWMEHERQLPPAS